MSKTIETPWGPVAESGFDFTLEEDDFYGCEAEAFQPMDEDVFEMFDEPEEWEEEYEEALPDLAEACL